MNQKESNRIREIRLSKGMTLQEVANNTGITTDPAQIQKIEKGMRSLTPKWLKAISKALNVQPYELLPLEWQPDENAHNLKLISVPLIAKVQEGVWQHGSKFFDASELLTAHDSAQSKGQHIFTNRPDPYKEEQLFAVEVQDDTLNSHYPRGTVLLCVKEKFYGKIENGKRVVCLKTSKQMHASQIYVRRYVDNKGQKLLFSLNESVLDVESVKSSDLEILGVIIKSIRSE